MKILGIDPSLKSTGWCVLEYYNTMSVSESGFISTPDTSTTVQRIGQIADELYSKRLFSECEYVFMESEAYGAKGRSLVQLAELAGAIKYAIPNTLTFTPSQARKLVLGSGKVPEKGSSKKSKEAYCAFIEARIGLHLEPVTDIYDAFVIARAGLYELLTPDPNEDLMMMRLHDEKLVGKSNKGLYTFGTGKKALKFKALSKLQPEIQEELKKLYKGILIGKRYPGI